MRGVAGKVTHADFFKIRIKLNPCQVFGVCFFFFGHTTQLAGILVP